MVGRTGRIRITAKPESGDFWIDYGRLLAGGQPVERMAARVPTTAKTWRWLCEQYFKSMKFKRLAPRGQRIRRRQLEATYSEPTEPGSVHLFGNFPLIHFNAMAVRILRDRKVRWVADESGHETSTNLEAANSLLKYIRALLAFAKEEHPAIVSRNWGLDVDYFRTGSKGFPPWSLNDIAQFEKHHAVGTKARLTMALALYGGQRRGDLTALGRICERDGFLHFIQEKNRRNDPVEAHVPIVPPLRAIIDASPTGDLFYIVKDNGQPYKKESLGNLFKKWCIQAGLPNRSLHGLRKSCTIRMIMDDCTPHEIMSVTGHRTLKEIDRYARDYLRGRAAERVLEKWVAKHASASATP